LAAGHRDEALRLLGALEAFANIGGMISEQVWDSDDIPEKELFCGRPSGSAMPLVWAHAEYLKLLRSLRDGQVFDTPPQPAQRYIEDQVGSPYAIWRFNHKARSMPQGQTLRIEVLAPATVHWTADGWDTSHDVTAGDTGLGIYVADLDTSGLPADASVTFTFYWSQEDRWEETDVSVRIEEGNKEG
jgi:glucoamylase